LVELKFLAEQLNNVILVTCFKAREKEEEQKRIEKENKEKEELEKFEKWQQGKKKPGRERKRRHSEVEEVSWLQRYLKTAIYSTIAAVMLGFLINLLQA
jgi:Ni/Co efflux regulator RcnB